MNDFKQIIKDFPIRGLASLLEVSPTAVAQWQKGGKITENNINNIQFLIEKIKLISDNDHK